MDAPAFERARRYVGFDQDSARTLRSVHPRLQKHFRAIADDFYDAIEQDPVAAGVLSGGAAQIARLKHTLVDWLDSLLLGPHDSNYLVLHSRTGQVHVRIGLPQELILTAMNRVRSHLNAALHEELGGAVAAYLEASDALHKVIDLELGIMLDTYREHLSDKVRASERLSTIGQLTASIGHELRNPLATMESSLYLSKQRLDSLNIADAELSKHHHRMALQLSYCRQTIADLLDLARNLAPDIRRHALKPLMARAIEEISASEQYEISVDAADDAAVFADGNDLQRVLVNLLMNAMEAQPSGGRIHVSAKTREAGSEIFVEDDGPGIPHESRSRIFDALFTTKPKGSGLGLALCRRIVDAHRGEIEALDRQHGACIRVWLPHRELEAAPARSSTREGAG